MGTIGKIKKGIQHDPKLAMKVNLVPLGVAMIGCQLFIAVPEKPNMEPEMIAQRVRASMSEIQERASRVSVRDIYEIVVDMQKQEN